MHLEGIEVKFTGKGSHHPQVCLECPSVSRADVAKVAGVGFGVAGITDSVKPVTTWPGSIWEKDIFIHEKGGLNKACTSCTVTPVPFSSWARDKVKP